LSEPGVLHDEQAEPLRRLGSEGAVFDFEEPLRVGGERGGTFVAAELKDKKGDSFVLRFEQNDGHEGQVMRINGSETFCRRLEKK
jgi:hypothetical protein